MTMPLEFYSEKFEEVRCPHCNFFIGFSQRQTPGDNRPEITCIYCMSEWQFARNEFSGSSRGSGYIYATIPEDQTPWRRGLMHSRKRSVRDLVEYCDPEEEEHE